MTSKANITKSTEIYNAFKEHSKEDIEKVKSLQDEEQQRRIADTEGEKQKQATALRVSELFSLNIRPTWFQKGSSYTLKIIKLAREAGNSILRSSQVKTINAKLQVAGQKGVATAQDLKQKIVSGAHKAQDSAKETVQDVKEVVQEKLSSAPEVGQKVGEKVQEVGKRLKRLSLKLISRVNKTVSDISNNSNIAFAVLEEENERLFRTSNEWEGYAMLNAFRVSNLIKELGPAFYRPDFEPNGFYAIKLLEGVERQRRMLSDLSDRVPISNAKAVAQLIEHKNRATTLPTPALVAAKAEIVEEIKVHKPIPATM